MRKKWVTIQMPLEAKEEIVALVGDTRRPIHSFLVEAMRIREALKSKGKLEKMIQAIQGGYTSQDAPEAAYPVDPE